MELTSHHQLEKLRKGQKETPPPTYQNSQWHPSWLSNACTTWNDPWVRMIGQNNLETNPITIKLQTARYVAEQFSRVLLAYCSKEPCPIKSLALSAHVSPLTILSQVLDKSPILGPGRGPLFCNSWKGASETRTADELMEHLRT